MSKRVSYVLGIIGLVLSVILIVINLIGGLFGVIMYQTNKLEQQPYYSLSGIEVPSIQNVLGERNISGFHYSKSFGCNIKNYNYTYTGDTKSDISTYANYLVEHEGFTKDIDTLGIVSVYKKVNSNKILTIQMIYMEHSYSITLYYQTEFTSCTLD